MLRGLVLLASAALSVNLGAASLSCSLSNASGTVVSQSCYSQALFFPDPTVNWLTGLGEATQGLHSGPWTTSNQAINVTLTSAGLLQRSDNTAFAWDGIEWTLPSLVPPPSPGQPPVSTFAGHFAAPNLPCLANQAPCSNSNPPTFATPDVGLTGGQFGDDLVGVVGGAPLTITFATPVTSAGFMISARTLSDFSATLQAFDAQNNLIGTYAIVAGGLGGTCAGLTAFVNNMPQPCTGDNAFSSPAPFIGFVAPGNQMIASLVLQTNDNTGLFIDQMYGVPEPSTTILVSGGLGLLAWLLRRRARVRLH
jgi:hypothetical protein